MDAHLLEENEVATDRKEKKELIFKALAQQESACYVLITCGKPTEDGRMDVEFTYEGDAGLASYLLESAQNYLDESLKEELG